MDNKLLQQAALYLEVDQEPAKQESPPSESGDELSAALLDKRIQHIPDSKSENEDDHDVEIRQSLRYAMLVVGIRATNMPAKEEKDVIIQFIKKYYGTHTPLELKLAFDLAINGQLDLEDVKCYENFSCEYVGRILVAYRKWAAKEVNWKDNKRVEEPLQIEAPKEIDWSDKWEQVKDAARIGLTELNNMIILTTIYDWLERTGKLVLDKEAKQEIFTRARNTYILQLQDKINEKKGEREDYESLAAMRIESWVNDPRLLSNVRNISKIIATKELALFEISSE